VKRSALSIADLVAACNNEMKEVICNGIKDYDAIMTLVKSAMTGAMTVDELGRAIRPHIEFTESQREEAHKYYKKRRKDYLKKYIESGMSKETAGKKAEKEALARKATYEGQLHRWRAFDIACTEMAYAANSKNEEITRQWINEGSLPSDTRRRWSSSADRETCKVCRALDGVTVGMDESFPGGVTLPPVHPNCRCAVAYVFD